MHEILFLELQVATSTLCTELGETQETRKVAP